MLENNNLLNSIKNKDIEKCKLLIKKGADVNKQDDFGITPLIYAISSKNIEICKLLIENGADISKEDTFGITPLIHSIKTKNIEICKLLIEKGADVNKRDNFGNTPLIYAINTKNIEICKLLIENEANITSEVLKDASKLNNKDIYNLLKEYYNIESFIKNKIKEFITTQKIDTDNILNYFYKLYSNQCNITYYNLNTYTTERNNELNKLLRNIQSQNLLSKKIKIKYLNENGQNASGLSKEFFDNLQTQINLKIKAKKELELKNKVLNSQINELSKSLTLKSKTNNNNIIKLLQKNIDNTHSEINKLTSIIENSKDYDINEILKILAISKLNCNPIFYINDAVKETILNKITNLFDKSIEKNIVYNSLSYISSDEPNSFITEDNNILLNYKYIQFLSNKVASNENINYKNVEDTLKKLKNNYIKILTKNNKNLEMEYLTNNNIKELEKNNNLNYDENIIEFIGIMISLKIYEDIYDFFYSHFYQKKIDIDSFLPKLQFEFSGNMRNNRTSIKNEFYNLFRELTTEELYIFNKAISGNTFKLSNKYLIKIIFSNENEYPRFHTCFNTMDVHYNDFYRETYLVRENFVNIIKLAIEGFNAV